MSLFDKYRDRMPKERNKESLDEHYDNIELEKGDLAAMLIAALITFGPLILVISIVYIGLALLFF